MKHDTTSGPQHLRALAKANEVRLARAELKRQVQAGEVSAAEVILQRAWEADSMTVADLLMAQRRWGYARCRTFLQRIQISETKTVGSMTERQRIAVAQMLACNEQRATAPQRFERERELEPALA